MSDSVGLLVGGANYTGWESVKITKSIETVAGTFELTASERWANAGKDWPINEEDECVVSIGKDTLITGYVDSREPEYAEGAHSLSISGKDKAAAIVECSADLGVWEFVNYDVYKLAKKICDPHGIKVSIQPGLQFTAVKKLAVEPGDTGFTVLEHACRLAGVLPVSSGDSEIILTQAGDARAKTDLVEGKNIKRAKGKFDASGRFSTYKLLGQHATSPEFFGEQAAHIQASATDPNVKRTSRTLIVRPEGNVTAEYAKLRVQWEATVRAARADSVQITVHGWRMSDGNLWPVNALVHVKSPKLRVDGDMLISEVTFEAASETGKLTTLKLRRPDAFKPEPLVQSDGLWKEISKGV